MTSPKNIAGLADKLIEQGHAEPADKPLIDKFAAREPEQAKRMADVAFRDPRSARFMGVLKEFGDAPRLSDRHNSGQTMRTETNQAKHLAAWFTPDGMRESTVESYLKAHAIVKSVVDIPQMSADFSAKERTRWMDIAGDMAFGQSMSGDALNWRQTRASDTPEARFARDLATLQQAAMVMTPANVLSGLAADELVMTRSSMASVHGQRLLTTMKMTADLAYDGQISSSDYARDHGKYGPWKSVLGVSNQHPGIYLSLDAADRVQTKRAAQVAPGATASGPSFWQNKV
jgi:hypothetical protein